MIEPFHYKVHYSDTDAGGVVYHARYLEIFERARYGFLMQYGLDVAELARQGFIFAVVHIDISYRASARLWDDLAVVTRLVKMRTASIMCHQQMVRRGEDVVLCEANINLACVKEGKACRLPASVRDIVTDVISNS